MLYRKKVIPVVITFVVIMLNVFVANCQERGIKLEKVNRKNDKIIQEFSEVKIKLLNDKKLKGNFEIINDSTIRVNGIMVLINEISSVKKDRRIANGIGTILIAPEIGFLLIDALIIGWPVLSLAYSPFLVTGVILKITALKHKRDKGWNYSLME